MGIGKLIVIGIAVVLASGGIGAALADWRSDGTGGAIQLVDDARRDDVTPAAVVDDDERDDPTGDGDGTPGDDGTNGGANTGDGDNTAGNDGTSGGANTGDGDNTAGNDGTGGGSNTAAPAPAGGAGGDDTGGDSGGGTTG